VLEYEVDEMLGRKLSEFWPEGEGARLHAWFERNAPGTQRFHNLEHRALTKSGRMVWQRISGVPVFGPDGKPAGYRGTGLDITERRKADLRQTMEHAVTQVLSSAETLEEAAPKVLRILCESLGWAYGAHWRLDEEARMLRCVETWHIDAPEIAEFVAASSITLNEAPAWQSGSIGTATTETGGLVRRVWSRGAPVWFADVTRMSGFRRGAIAARAGLHCAFAFPVIVGEQPLGVIELFGRHIEEPDEALLQVVQAIGNQIGQFVARRQAEAAIRAANAELGRQAEDLARSNAELQQFAYVASHDLQEPLRMVSSYTQLIVKRYGGQLDTDAKEFMEFIVDGAARMKRLIEDLLAYSRVGTRGQGFQLTECEAALKKALINLRGSIEASGATVTYGRLPILNADGSQLTQLFQNLIGNAIKFKDADLPHIHVSADESEDAWVLKIKDNGIGIDPQYFERIFILFQRLHGKAEYPGTGIGLAICKKIMDRHGGRIWVESEPGHGSTFCCSLPKNS
jgi:signal transduction histidine kinase